MDYVIISVFLLLCLIIILLPIAWFVYEAMYYKSDKFAAIKSRIQSYIDDCNALNQHIDELKLAKMPGGQDETGSAEYTDESRWNSNATVASGKFVPNIYKCSATVCDNARRSPFKYICKYFGIPATEESLSQIEEVLNSFDAAEEGKVALEAERKSILDGIQGEVPQLIRKLSAKKLENKLGFAPVDFKTAYYPRYIFEYVSPGGNKSKKCEIVLNPDNLNKFIAYLSETVKFKQSVAGQRALMTSKLRQQIKERDHFTCRQCGVSLSDEPHLLLEIDHIVPVSRGGLTTEDNLQTLCWRCNRSKGAKTA